MNQEPSNKRVFLAGATGAIGQRLVPLLLRSGWEVFGTTRSPQRASELATTGAHPVVVDVFDAAALEQAVARAKPAIVMHQLTDLPRGLDPARMADAVRRNARIRTEGTANLVAAARAAGVTRIVAQSIAWAYAPGPKPHREDDPLDLHARGARAISVDGVAALEKQVLRSPPLEGFVLRHGQLYGPGTGVEDASAKTVPLHVDAAAWAALLAMEFGEPGIYNIAEPGAIVDIRKARRELGWSPTLRVADASVEKE